MKRGLVLFLTVSVFILVSGIIAQEITQEDLDEFVQDVAEQKGISPESIENITQVNFTDLPEGVNVQNIDDTHLSLYEIVTSQGASVFLITFSGETLGTFQEPKQILTQSKSLLTYGLAEQSKESKFLETSVGSESGLNKGYVMLGKGSLTGISTNLEVVRGTGKVEIKILKNEEQINFGNSLDISSEGVKKDYSIQSAGIVEFKEGDVISVYIKNEEGITVKDITILVEISNEVN